MGHHYTSKIWILLAKCCKLRGFGGLFIPQKSLVDQSLLLLLSMSFLHVLNRASEMMANAIEDSQWTHRFPFSVVAQMLNSCCTKPQLHSRPEDDDKQEIPLGNNSSKVSIEMVFH